MKKSNITLVAIVLIALHALVFAIVLGNRNGQQEKTKPHAPQVEVTEPDLMESLETFKVPDLVFPVDIVETVPDQPRETIAVAGTREGYLRADRANRHTSTVYPKLVGKPYRGAIVLNARTGKILYEDRATTYCYPASVTKLMTLLVVLDQITAGTIRLDDKVKITNEIAKIGGSQIWLDPRETNFTVEEMLYALMIHSANDAAYALAIHVAGSKDAFVVLMNKKAHALGMNSTTYHTPHGLPPSGGAQPDISTPYDIAILSLATLQNPSTLRYSGTELKYLRDGKTMLSTRNKLAKRIDGYPGCDGLKTGYHTIGGWSLAATAKRNGQRVVAVLLGCPDKNSRNATARKLLDKGFDALKK